MMLDKVLVLCLQYILVNQVQGSHKVEKLETGWDINLESFVLWKVEAINILHVRLKMLKIIPVK